MNATRFPLPPLPQPYYSFDEIPTAKRDLQASTLHRIDDRAVWQSCLGEMVLLCKEAVRRRRRNNKTGTQVSTTATTTTTASKPLSLEYLADRSDVDDPLWGYMVRNAENGSLQGFVTVTTFTNYHKSFRWDSLHPAAFEDGGDDANDESKSQDAAVDSNGRLAQELQATVRAGDIWQEGIVWPRIAEISLLGGLGCGRTLLSLVLEDLVHAKPTPWQHYDYVVLQATDNSIPFYESMGFLRVGALTTESNVAHAAGLASPRRQRHGTCKQDNDDNFLAQDWGSPMANKNHRATTQQQDDEPSDWVEGPATEQYTTKKAGETPLKIAQALRVNAHDIVFLNLRNHPDLSVASRLKAQTVLTVPKVLPAQTSRQRPHVEIQWYTAKENDTPRSIAKMFHVPCAQIVGANKVRLPGLLSSSRLKQGTKVRITKQDDGECWQAYSHWAFPDDDFEEGEPSYMMALKLPKSSRSKSASHRPVLESLAVDITEYQRPELLKDVVTNTVVVAPKVETPAPAPAPAPAPGPESTPTTATTTPAVVTTSTLPPQDALQSIVASFPPPPVPPKRPPAAFLLFCHDMRQRKAALLAGKNAGQAARILKDAYDLTADTEKEAYIKKAANMRQEFQLARAAYEKEMTMYVKAYPQAAASQSAAAASAAKVPTTPASSKTITSAIDTNAAVASPRADLFNKVVRLRTGAPSADGGSLDRYTYWYVLTYIPDLQWCHLAPMVAVGTFGPDKPKSEGRPKYKLEDEALGLEVDISSTFCMPVKAKSMRKTMDADKEEWDVWDDGTEPGSRRASLDGNAVASGFRSATKPSVVAKDRKRKRPSLDSTTSALSTRPFLEAVLPDTWQTLRVVVRQVGPGRPPKTLACTSVLVPPPSSLPVDRRTSVSSTTTTATVEDEEEYEPISVNGSSGGSSASNDSNITGGGADRPKRLSAPSFLGESPISPRVRQQSVRGRDPSKY